MDNYMSYNPYGSAGMGAGQAGQDKSLEVDKLIDMLKKLYTQAALSGSGSSGSGATGQSSGSSFGSGGSGSSGGSGMGGMLGGGSSSGSGGLMGGIGGGIGDIANTNAARPSGNPFYNPYMKGPDYGNGFMTGIGNTQQTGGQIVDMIMSIIGMLCSFRSRG